MMSVLFLLACVNNLILQASQRESWWMLVLEAAGVVIGIYFLITGKKNQLKEKGIVYFISFMVLLELFAILFNVFGRYNLSKTLLTSGYIKRDYWYRASLDSEIVAGNVIGRIQVLWPVGEKIILFKF